MATVPAQYTTLSMKSMAQEALYGTYGSGTITGPISLYDMVNGGDASSDDDYPAVNQSCLPNPADRTAPNELKSIGVCCGMDPVTDATFKSSEAINATYLANGDTLYANSSATIPWLPSGYTTAYEWCQNGDATSDTIAGVGQYAGWFVDASGVINSLTIS